MIYIVEHTVKVRTEVDTTSVEVKEYIKNARRMAKEGGYEIVVDRKIAAEAVACIKVRNALQTSDGIEDYDIEDAEMLDENGAYI